MPTLPWAAQGVMCAHDKVLPEFLSPVTLSIFSPVGALLLGKALLSQEAPAPRTQAKAKEKLPQGNQRETGVTPVPFC